MKLKLPDSVKGSSVSNHKNLNILGPFLIELSFLGIFSLGVEALRLFKGMLDIMIDDFEEDLRN